MIYISALTDDYTGAWYDSTMWYLQNVLSTGLTDELEEAVDEMTEIIEKDYPEMNTSGFSGVEADCPRAMLALFLAACIPEDHLEQINDIETVPDLNTEIVRKLYRTGILGGVDEYGTFDGHGTLTRAQMATIIARVIKPELRLKLYLKEPEYQETLVVYNWGEYMDTSLLKTFTDNSSVKVEYHTYSTAEELYAVLKSGARADVIITEDHMLDRLRVEGMLQKLDNPAGILNNRDRLPGLEALAFDPAGEYTVPYLWGVLGLAYDSTKVSSSDSWDSLFNERSGKVVMHDDIRLNMAMALKSLGYSINTTDRAQLDTAFNLLVKQKSQVKAYGDYYQVMEALENDDADIVPLYNVDAYPLCVEVEKLHFDLPEGGSIMFVDAAAVPASCKNKAAAELFIRFLCDTDVALKNAEYTGYLTPFRYVYEELPQELSPIPQMYPTADYLQSCEMFLNLPEETAALYEAYDIELKART